MCQPKSRGGQRCAAHTRADMETAQARYASEPSIDHYDALQAARAEYAATPTGQRDLEQQLTDAAPGGVAAIDLAAALRRGEMIRDRNQAVRAVSAEQAAARELATRLANATPTDVDTELAQKWAEQYRIEDRLQQAKRNLDYTESRLRRQQVMPYQQRELDTARARIAAYEIELAQAVEARAPYETEFRRRGGWSRFYETTGNGSNAHIHSSMGGCSTCYPTTRYAWHPGLSGKSEAEAVAEFGEKMCTVCYPSAPADPNFNGPGRRDRAEQDARRAERDQRAAEKAAKAITHKDGGKLRGGFGDEIKTLRTAQITLVQESAYIAHLEGLRDDPSNAVHSVEQTRAHYQSIIDKYQRGVHDIEEAIAAKTGRTVEEVRAEAAPKIAKKVAKGEW